MRLFKLLFVLTFLAVTFAQAGDAFGGGGDDLSSQPTIIICGGGRDDKVLLGEFCCPTPTGELLCWKSGPKAYKKDGYDVPYYFELTDDYLISTKHYFESPFSPPLPYKSEVLKKKRERLLILSKK